MICYLEKEKYMFEVKPEVKEAAVIQMLEVFKANGAENVTEEAVSEAFDLAVNIVKKSFGM